MEVTVHAIVLLAEISEANGFLSTGLVFDKFPLAPTYFLTFPSFVVIATGALKLFTRHKMELVLFMSQNYTYLIFLGGGVAGARGMSFPLKSDMACNNMLERFV